MKVAIFTDNDFDKVNGVTTTLTAALRYAPEWMHLRVYTASALPVDERQYLALRSIGVPIPFYTEMRIYLPRLLEYARRARADGIDVVHLTTPGPIGLAALFVAWQLRLPIVGSFHTDLAAYTAVLSGSPRLGALMREYMRWPYGKCERILAPSEHTRQLLIGAKGNPRKIEVWSRGVDTDLFNPCKRSQSLRDSWHVSDRRPALLYVGRVSREKGLKLLAPLRDRLHAMGVEHRFVIVGQGPLLPELRMAMPDAVFTGVMSREAVAEAFASADLFVFPSATETAGNVVLEAQASGLPVVISSEGGACENVLSGQTGLVCCSDDASEWARAISRTLGDAACQHRMALAAREYANGRSWHRALQPLFRAYTDVYARKAATTPRDAAHPAAQRV